ncbi:CRP-like cAMP-binding protein [Mesorhizobium sp. J18]|uniref:Crp/Fnr family transcriptional regulator n=1 Tax=Mesorhizobium sp. J18 TaxID=935263 RepID=UPI001199CDD7|nr:Crp/Fnr family transcriptional regulator [Mesorhizobium sp. J18]TWH01317.1 CRP-like cAMP-binding protein [Mesorhizobium sp. J18]
MSQPLLIKLARRDELSDEERQAVEAAIAKIDMVAAGRELVAEGARLNHSILLIEGFTARCKILRDGTRQIASLHIDGDFIDLHSFVLKVMDHTIVALTQCRIAIVPHERLKLITERYPHLTRLLWLNTVIDAAIHREWLVSVGRRSAQASLAHLLCEMYLRLHAVGKVTEWSFVLPVTQADLGDMLGLSIVHVNRNVKKLRETGFIVWEGSRVTIRDWDRLSELAEFDPTYLSLNVEAR